MAGRPPLMNADELHQRITVAAARVFAERGFNAATIDEIVRRAKINKPALYRAYESKSHLYSALIETHATETARVSLAALASVEGTIEERLPSMISAWFAHVLQQPDLFRILHRDPPADEMVDATYRRIKALQVGNDVALLRQFAPTLPKDEIAPLGEVLRSSLVALAIWWLDHPGVSQDVPVAAMVRVCRGLLLAAPTANGATPAERGSSRTAKGKSA
jgi:AcrR family transcriptional regulator